MVSTAAPRLGDEVKEWVAVFFKDLADSSSLGGANHDSEYCCRGRVLVESDGANLEVDRSLAGHVRADELSEASSGIVAVGVAGGLSKDEADIVTVGLKEFVGHESAVT